MHLGYSLTVGELRAMLDKMPDFVPVLIQDEDYKPHLTSGVHTDVLQDSDGTGKECVVIVS